MRIASIVVIICLAVATTYMWQSAEAKTKDARASYLNLQSRDLSQDPRTLEKNILLAIESFRIHRTSDADQLIRRGLSLIPHSFVSLNHNASVNTVVFSPDGKYVATASRDKTARLWNASAGKQILVLNHDGRVKKVVFSSDGKYVATRSADNTAHLWNASTGKQILVMNHDDGVSNVVFSPDGKYVATASAGKTARLWICNTDDLINETSNRLTRNLTPEEWKRYMGDEPYQKTFPNLP